MYDPLLCTALHPSKDNINRFPLKKQWTMVLVIKISDKMAKAKVCAYQFTGFAKQNDLNCFSWKFIPASTFPWHGRHSFYHYNTNHHKDIEYVFPCKWLYTCDCISHTRAQNDRSILNEGSVLMCKQISTDINTKQLGCPWSYSLEMLLIYIWMMTLGNLVSILLN